MLELRHELEAVPVPRIVRLVDHRKMGNRTRRCRQWIIEGRAAQIDMIEREHTPNVQIGHGLQIGLDMGQVVDTVPLLQQVWLQLVAAGTGQTGRQGF